jgi:hypothetical protein
MSNTKIYRHYQGGIQKLQPLTSDDFILMCEVTPRLIDRVIVTERGRFYLILN